MDVPGQRARALNIIVDMTSDALVAAEIFRSRHAKLQIQSKTTRNDGLKG